MKYETIIYEKDKEGIATLTFNRPRVMNALNYQQLTEVNAALKDVNSDDEVRVLIITGAGRGFHAGDDVKEMFLADDAGKRKAEGLVAQVKSATEGPLLWIDVYKPTIAAVNGAAVGLGLLIALSCDIRLASENAKFGWHYIRLGLMGGVLGHMALKNIVGLSRALEMMLSGELVDAAEAERIGLVSRVVPQERLMDEARKLAHKLMQGAPLAQQAIKRSVYKAMFEPSSVQDYVNHMSSLLTQTEDVLEGARAFAEKREPKYKGR